MHLRKLLMLIVVIVIVTIINNVNGEANAGSSLTTTKSESAVDNPKAEALTLVIHDLPTSPRFAKIPPQVKVIKDRSDDVVHVFHTRPKRQRQSSRKRRPSNNVNFRSRIKSPSSSQSNVGGFKDFSSSDFRNPPRGFGEPPRATNKFKFGPPQSQFEGYNYQKSSKKSQKRERPSGPPPSKNYGHPPPSQNQVDTQFAAAPSTSSSQSFFVDHAPIQTLQQHHNFPPHQSSHDAVQSSSTNNFVDDQFSKPLSNFPLEKGPNFNFPKTSYGYPVRTSVNSSPGITKSNQFSVLGTNLEGNPIQNQQQFPKLPNRYEQHDFSTPTRTNPLSAVGNQFLNNNNEFNSGFNDAAPNYPRQSNRQNFQQFNKFQNFDYDFKNRFPGTVEDDDDDEEETPLNLNFNYQNNFKRPVTTSTTTTTQAPFTTKRPRRNFGSGAKQKKNRPAANVPQTHNLDTDDLRDAYGEYSDIHEFSTSAEDYKNYNTDFDSQRNTRRSQPPQHLHELSSTLKKSTKYSNNNNNNNLNNEALRTALGDDYQILSVHKSLEKDPRDVDFGFLKKHDHFNREFSVGSEINFGGPNPPQNTHVWPENFPKNHRMN